MDTEIPELAPDEARFHVLPVPYEKTVSYGHGTALGPGSIIAASGQLERWDGSSDPGTEGIYTWPAVDCAGEPKRVIADIAAAVARILALGQRTRMHTRIVMRNTQRRRLRAADTTPKSSC